MSSKIDDWQTKPVPEPVEVFPVHPAGETNPSQSFNDVSFWLILIAILMILSYCGYRFRPWWSKTSRTKSSENGQKVKFKSLVSCLLFSAIVMMCALILPHFIIARNEMEIRPLKLRRIHSGVTLDSINVGQSYGIKSSNTAIMGSSRSMDMQVNKKIGFSVGGAKDINNFRDNVKNGYLPSLTSITYEGLFYDYYFDTGIADQERNSCKSGELFCASYIQAISENPITNETEYFLTVGLNSGITDFKRKKLNLVIVLDISGSMVSQFNKYYYDGNKGMFVLCTNTSYTSYFTHHKMKGGEKQDMNDNRNKMEVAKYAMIELISHLNADDRLGIVLFQSSADIVKPLNLVGNTDMNAIKQHIINDVYAYGGTNFEAGYVAGTSMFENIEYDSKYDNRIIFLTDAMPNIGQISDTSLIGLTSANAKNDIRIYSTFIGIGVDFNTKLIEHITKIRGANYFAVHSNEEFMNRMKNEFSFMVTPLVFNLQLNVESSGFEIERVFGSPEADLATGQIMKVNTLFPSATDEHQRTKGGIILIKLKKKDKQSSNAINLMVSYEDGENKAHSNKVLILFEEEKQSLVNDTDDFYENNGIRKAILLTRYVQLMKQWITDENENVERIKPKNSVVETRSQWEQTSREILANKEYGLLFERFVNGYFAPEIKEIGDKTLEKELETLQKLVRTFLKKPVIVPVDGEGNLEA